METITMWAEMSSSAATNARRNAPDTHVQNAILSTEDAAKIRKDAEFAIGNVPNIQRFKNANGETYDFTEEVCTTNNDEAVCMVNTEELVEIYRGE